MLDWIKILWSVEARSRPWALCSVAQTILNGICGVTEHIMLLKGGGTISSSGAVGVWSAVVVQGLGSSTSRAQTSGDHVLLLIQNQEIIDLIINLSLDLVPETLDGRTP